MRGVPAALAAMLLAAMLPATPARGTPAGPGCGVQVLVGAPSQNRYRLAHPFLRAGSDSLWTRRATWARGRDYLLDPLRGEIRVLTTLVPGETLWVAACWLVAPPPLEVSHHDFVPAPVAGAAPARRDSTVLAVPARPSTGRDLTEAQNGASLNVTGNKTVAVDFGSSQDAALRQSLDLALSGQLAPGVELTGVLSDRNTPLTVAGSTQDLQTLDRVLIELRAPHAAAALGDVPLAIDRGSFARLDRQVQGVRGEWHQGGFDGMVAAASAQGVYRRMQFNGIDGLQGPYLLTDAEGATGVAVVAGSEVVTVDGQRLARGESADYAMDYERGRLTFTNRRPISSASRVTIEYQFALNRYRRNIAAFSGGWTGARARLYASAITESDDRGRPLDLTLSATDQLALSLAGDSTARAVGLAVVPGVGDYDSVRVAPDTLVYAFAGPDSGHFAVSFTRVNPGAGDYADSAIVQGRTAYRWVGPGRGSFVIGRSLPLPESHQLLTLGGAWNAGPFTLEAEGALSRLDHNTFSPLDDRDDAGGAGRVALSAEGRAGFLPGRVGIGVGGRQVERAFQPFSQLERPFAEQDWGLPVGADLEHQRRADASGWWRPRSGDELRAELSRLTTPDGYAGSLRRAEWTGGGRLATHALVTDAGGDLAGLRFAHGGRRHVMLEARRPFAWLAPALRYEHDDRRTPADSATVRDRVDEVGGDLASGPRPKWKLSTGLSLRRERHDSELFTSDLRATTVRAAGESPAGGPVGVSFLAQRRGTRDPASGARTFADLASAKLRGERRPWGLSGQLDVEVTSEAENPRVRTLVFAGTGRGSYDALGNFVGTGDYDLVLAVSPELQRYTRVVTSARTGWTFGSGESWKGSRVDFTLEDEARRAGALRPADAFLSTGLALVDPALVKGAVLQRLESDLAPGSRTAALRVRLERRVTADRTFANFSQTLDQRSGTLRWRARPTLKWTIESEGRTSWQRAAQSLGPSGYGRTLLETGVQAQATWQPGAVLRAAAVADLSYSRPEGQVLATRTLLLGPDASFGVGPRGRADVSVRHAIVSGPPASALLPSADPAGAARWSGTARFDLRVHETTTVGISGNVSERPDHPTVVAGRAEVRAFF